MIHFNRLHEKSVTDFIRFSYSDFMILKRFAHRRTVKKWYQTLGVEENCEDETLRLAFVHLAKRFHPDSGTSEANAVRFSEIESAYRQIRKTRLEEKEKDAQAMEAEEFDIKHTAPQHRHYLVHNIGVGTPSRRQRLYTIERAQKAVNNVMEHRLQKIQAAERNTLVGMDKQRAKDIKTRFGMDRLVEDLIQEAMNKGEFSDLPGMGKPLKENVNARNPYVDFVTHKLNEVLIDNGFTPEWIQLSKEIREETKDLRKSLSEARNKVGPVPLTPMDETTWEQILEELKPTVKRLNNKIDKYNLVVPILQKQMLHVKFDDLAKEALSLPPVKKSDSKKNVPEKQYNSISSIISSIFDKKVT